MYDISESSPSMMNIPYGYGYTTASTVIGSSTNSATPEQRRRWGDFYDAERFHAQWGPNGNLHRGDEIYEMDPFVWGTNADIPMAGMPTGVETEVGVTIESMVEEMNVSTDEDEE
eukprot:338186_1